MRSRPLGKHRIRLTATMVDSFTVTDDARARTLIPQTIDIYDRHVHIVGVIPATLTLETRGRSIVEFELEEKPFELRQRFKWIAV